MTRCEALEKSWRASDYESVRYLFQVAVQMIAKRKLGL